MRSKIVIVALVAVGMISLFAGGTSAKKGKGKANPAFRTTLSGYQEVPALSTPASGDARFKVKKPGPVINYRLTYGDISNVVAAHIHLGQVGVNGGVIAFLCGGGDKPACPPTGGTVRGTIDADDVIGPVNQGIAPGEIGEVVKAMRAGVVYANVHTSDGDDDPGDPMGPGDFPSGEIRGQLGIPAKKAK